MKKPLKIAIYSGAIPSTTFIEHLIIEVAKYHKVLLIGNVKEAKDYNNKNIKVVATPYSKWQYVPLTIWRLIRLLFTHPKRIILAYKSVQMYPTNYLKLIRFTRYVAVLLLEPDIFHIQWPRRLERWTFLKEAYPVKIVQSLLGTQVSIAPKSNDLLAQSFKTHFPQVDAFNAVSEKTAKDALSYGAERHKIRVIPIPIAKKAFQQFRYPETIKDQIRIVSVGRHDWVKGYRYAIDAMKLMLDKGMSFSYTIIAQGKVPEELLFQVHQLGLTKHVTFKSGIEQATLFDDMQAHDVLLLPSVSEGIANVAIEAMALGIPVISTECGGMPEVINDKITGWLVQNRDPECIRDALLDVMTMQTEALHTIVKNAFDLAAVNFHPDRVIPEYIAFYENLYDEDA